jgi:diguanylate cyclase (GGDEF)-like protein
MEAIELKDWALIHFGLIFAVTTALMLVVYVLTDANNPTPGLGLYTIYFMVALLGWIAYTLKQVSQIPMTLDVPAVATILNSYILSLAAAQRADRTGGRYILGALCVAACLTVFFLPYKQMFLVQITTTGIFFIFTCAHMVNRCIAQKNVGDGVTAAAAFIMFASVTIALYQILVANNRPAGEAIAFGAQSTTFVLVAIGFLASVIVDYHRTLAQLITHDPLTRLLNRRGLERALQVTLAQAARQQQPISGILVDIDQFRDINDNFGHDVGDQVIKRVADILLQMCRSSDVLGRTDGEEFFLVLPLIDLEGARILAERIREKISEHPLIVDSHRVPTSVSIGVAYCVGDETLDKLSQDADRAMHLAKRGGKNQVASVESKPIHLSSRPGKK